jgi:hypothetical protein
MRPDQQPPADPVGRRGGDRAEAHVEGFGPSRADVLSDLVDFAFDALCWISEAPNRSDCDGTSLELAERARAACDHITVCDPDREYDGA